MLVYCTHLENSPTRPFTADTEKLSREGRQVRAYNKKAIATEDDDEDSDGST